MLRWGIPALVDATAQTPVTELRIHGVSGSSGPTMLEHPVSEQVAGDETAGFHRRWTVGLVVPVGPVLPTHLVTLLLLAQRLRG